MVSITHEIPLRKKIRTFDYPEAFKFQLVTVHYKVKLSHCNDRDIAFEIIAR